MLGTLRTRGVPLRVTVISSAGSTGALTPALKESGRNLSSEVSVPAVRSRRKKSPHCAVVQSTVTPLPVIDEETFMAIGPVELIEPCSPVAVTQS